MKNVYRLAGWLGLLSLTSVANAGVAITARELLESSIAFHDPEGVWGTAGLSLAFEETRPDGSVRSTNIAINIPAELFSWTTVRNGHELAGELHGKHCELRLDGRTEVGESERQQHRLSCERLERTRDYYTYLWGLPMKLRDPGTRLSEEVTAAVFQEINVWALQVTYDVEVGSDTWYFYFEPESAALLGYRFFHDESKNDGEYVVLEELAIDGGLRLPKTRAWYYNDGGGYLGTDTLVSLEVLRNDPSREP